MNKTYAELLKFLLTLSPEQLNQTATIYLTGIEEVYGLSNTAISGDDNDIVDPGTVLLLVHDS